MIGPADLLLGAIVSCTCSVGRSGKKEKIVIGERQRSKAVPPTFYGRYCSM